jgi:ABC-type transport system involved in cytochrome bd biosynthesis fused ATPase/permease subunit
MIFNRDFRFFIFSTTSTRQFVIFSLSFSRFLTAVLVETNFYQGLRTLASEFG